MRPAKGDEPIIVITGWKEWIGLNTDSGLYLAPEEDFLGTLVYDEDEDVACDHVMVQMLERGTLAKKHGRVMGYATESGYGLRVKDGFWTVHDSLESAVSYLSTYNWKDLERVYMRSV